MPCSHWKHQLSGHVHICTHILQEHFGLPSPCGNLFLAQTFYSQPRENTGTERSQFTSSAGSTSLLATREAPFLQAVPTGWVERGEAEGENQKPRASLTKPIKAPRAERPRRLPKSEGGPSWQGDGPQEDSEVREPRRSCCLWGKSHCTSLLSQSPHCSPKAQGGWSHTSLKALVPLTFISIYLFL